jgi:hypothetical protein
MEPLPPLPILGLFIWFQMFGQLKGDNSFNNKSNFSPCNLDCDPSLNPISLSPRNILLVNMVMVKG